MMTNLFSMFDPSTALLNSNWMMIMTPFVIMLPILNKTNKLLILLKKIINKMMSEMSTIMEESKKNTSLMTLLAIFMSILMFNLSSLYPYNFTITSQISISFTMSLTFWLMSPSLGISKNFMTFMAHLLPMGTPPILMPIMIIIELISQLIRPITLSIRLTANMLAGHLLLSLLGSMMIMSKINFILCFPLLLMLIFLEICVSMIQAFVLTTLINLYSTEIK